MMPRSRAARVLRSLRSDRGSNVVELAVMAPGLMMICMLILQFGLWFNARQAALASAQAGAAGEELPLNVVLVTVSGPLGYSVFPFFGLHLTISATAGGPVECFRPATQNRCG